jgi:hypothetical protein
METVEQELARVGVPRPVSFSWPGNHFGPEMVAELRRRGYRYGRRGPQPEPVEMPVLGSGPLYEPGRHDPLLIPTGGLAVPEWTLDDFRRIVERAGPGRIMVLQFHGVPDLAHPFCTTPPERFAEFMDWLYQEQYHVIAMRDLAALADAGEVSDDPMLRTRFYR